MSKSIIFLLKSFLGNFYRHLAIFFWSLWTERTWTAKERKRKTLPQHQYWWRAYDYSLRECSPNNANSNCRSSRPKSMNNFLIDVPVITWKKFRQREGFYLEGVYTADGPHVRYNWCKVITSTECIATYKRDWLGCSISELGNVQKYRSWYRPLRPLNLSQLHTQIRQSYAEIKHSDLMLQVTWLVSTN